jgi:transposase-like protein
MAFVAVSSGTRIDSWRGGQLRLFRSSGSSRVEDEDAAGREYRPIGDGWAVRVDRPLCVPLPNGIWLDFAVRNGQMQCVGIQSLAGGVEITTSLLRTIEPELRRGAREMWRANAVRLIEHEGEVAAEVPLQGTRPTISWGSAGLEADGEEELLRRRRPLSDEKLRRVAELYREAEAARLPRTAYIAGQFPHATPSAIRNWVRHARKRGFLGSAPRPRVAGEERRQESNAERGPWMVD